MLLIVQIQLLSKPWRKNEIGYVPRHHELLRMSVSYESMANNSGNIPIRIAWLHSKTRKISTETGWRDMVEILPIPKYGGILPNCWVSDYASFWETGGTILMLVKYPIFFNTEPMTRPWNIQDAFVLIKFYCYSTTSSNNEILLAEGMHGCYETEVKWEFSSQNSNNKKPLW